MTVLGLPEGIRACLFDLDCVLTRRAVLHAAAWKTMFDDFLSLREGAGFRPFDPVADYAAYVADRRPTGSAPSRLPAASSFARAVPTAFRTARRCTGWAPGRTLWCSR